MSELDDIEAIKQLKYRYFRFLDSKSWAELEDCFAENATSAYDGGKYSFEGRDAIMEFLRGSLGNDDIVSMHHGHHPEIQLIGDTTARGTWYLEDTVIFRHSASEVHGAGFYHDEYVKERGQWKIRSTGYVRTFEELRDRDSVQHLRTMFDGDGGRVSNEP